MHAESAQGWSFLWSLASLPRSCTTHIQQGATRRHVPGLQVCPSQQDAHRQGTRLATGQSPPRGQRRETGCACEHPGLCGHIPSPQGLVGLGKRPGEGSLVSPRMICHCLMRLMSPGGWYAAVLGHSLEADAHGNLGKWGPQCGSPARWFPLICGRGRG